MTARARAGADELDEAVDRTERARLALEVLEVDHLERRNLGLAHGLILT